MLSSSSTAVPDTPVFRTGDVSVLLVSVCEPVSVATVESIAKVTALPEPDVSIPVPPVKVMVSLSRSMLNAPPESAWKSRSCAVTCESTYAFTDCCVGTKVALLDDISSSSTKAVTLIVPSEIVSKVRVPVNVGPAVSALVPIAVEIASNSVSNSEPRMIFPESPVGSESLASKSVVLV